jgi:ATP-dependent DNA helicase RecQ
MEYRDRPNLHAPHIEDVLVSRGSHTGEVEKLEALLRRETRPWRGNPRLLFHGTVSGTPSGTAYVPKETPPPKCSTGYWIPGHDLERLSYDEKIRFLYLGDGPIDRFSWVGMEDPPESIPAGSLVRVSLARLYSSSSAPAGYYVQISGVYFE